MPLRATAAARTTEGDVRAVAEVSQRAGVPVDVYAFLGCSPLRRYVEGWTEEWLVERVRVAGDTARREGLTLCLVMEDTTRTPPEMLRRMFAEAIAAGATRLCLCDTVGHADPHGTRALVTFALDTLQALGAPHVTLDWHGHNDRGLALGNALAAAHAGALGIHATAGGVGERSGNVPMEHLLAHLGDRGARGPATPEALDRYRTLTAITQRPAARDGGSDVFATIRLRVNGEDMERAVRHDRTLLELLRDDLDLVATKQGCDEGDCGACTVLLDGEAVLACLTLAVCCDGRSVVTAESLDGPPKLDPLLDAFDRTGAGQCGFCTSGMLMSAKALLAREPSPSRQRIREAISGNLCRCTGYQPIVDAIELAAKGTGALPRAEHHLPTPMASYGERRK